MEKETARKQAELLLAVHPTNRDKNWLSLTLETLQFSPLFIPNVHIDYDGVLPYLHVLLAKPNQHADTLEEQVHSGLLQFGTGLAIHISGSNGPAIRLKHGDLVNLFLNKSLVHLPVQEDWKPVNATAKGEPDSQTGKIALGETTLEPIPPEILPKETQDNIQGFLHKIYEKTVPIGLLRSPLTQRKCLVVLTGKTLQEENPLPLLQLLTWHTPSHYRWMALQSHEEEENIKVS